MDVSWLGPRSAGAGVSVTGGLFLPDLLKLTTVSPQAQALREQRDDKDERRRRERDTQDSATGVAQSPTQVIRESERDMAPGSHAAQREAQAERDQSAATQRQSFQRTLADAAARQSVRADKPTGTGASSGESAVEPGRASDGTVRTNAPAQDAPINAEGKSVTAGARQSVNSAAETAVPPNGAAQSKSSVMHASALPPAPSQTANAARTTASVQAVESLGAARAAGGQATAAGAATGSKAAAASGTPPTAATAISRDGIVKTDAPTARTTAAAAAETSKSDANVEQIVRVLRSQISSDRARATLRLDPPELGTIKLHMDLRNETLSLRVDTQTPAAHRLLSEQIESLRDGLAASGIQLEHVEIRPPVPQSDAGVPTPGDQPDTNPGSQDGAGHANAEHSSRQGTESSGAPQVAAAARDAISEPAAESLVNILA